MKPEHFDVLIIGAGLSGICAAYYLQTQCPSKRYTILEGRDVIGGTWDLFRYPGIRSDSDMYTLGYSFRPWTQPEAIADGSAILNYIQETSREYNIDRHIRFNHRVCRASWSSQIAKWTVEVENGLTKERIHLTSNFLHMCTGYYDYDHGYTPTWAGTEQFKGRIIHPQHWPIDLDYKDKEVIVIGSGATAVTLVPAMAQQAAHVIMLQRSPSYIFSSPAKDIIANWLHRLLPTRLAHRLARWRSILWQLLSYILARRFPQSTKKNLLKLVEKDLGPEYDIETHFSPSYNPWDQRLCLVPDADLFKAIKAGKVSVVTDHIQTFTETGLRLQSGAELKADIIITATGLKLRLMSGLQLIVDGQEINLGDTMTYKGAMLSNVPNLALTLGYINASWTLKAELVATYVCRLLNYMDQYNYDQCLPRLNHTDQNGKPALDFTSGYVLRALDHLPKQGSQPPWIIHQNYLRDMMYLRIDHLDDGIMQFTARKKEQPLMTTQEVTL